MSSGPAVGDKRSAEAGHDKYVVISDSEEEAGKALPQAPKLQQADKRIKKPRRDDSDDAASLALAKRLLEDDSLSLARRFQREEGNRHRGNVGGSGGLGGAVGSERSGMNKRTSDHANDRDFGPHGDQQLARCSPLNLVFIPNIISEETNREMMAYYKQESRFSHEGERRRGSFQEGRSGEPVLSEKHGLLLQEAIPNIKKFLEKHPSAVHDELSSMLASFAGGTVTVNRYETGTQLGFHHDPPRANPLVVAITMGDDKTSERTMVFQKNEIKHKLETPMRSGYVFWGDAYTLWKHGSMKIKKKSDVVYSATFRNLRGDEDNTQDFKKYVKRRAWKTKNHNKVRM
jgi:hypothetical protein